MTNQYITKATEQKNIWQLNENERPIVPVK